MSPDQFPFKINPATREFFGIKRVPYLEGLDKLHDQNLGSFVQNIFLQFALAIEAYKNGQKPPPRLAVIFDGPPGDGKSYLINIFNRVAEDWGGERHKEDLMNMSKGSTNWMARNPWEVTGLRAARLEGAITTGRYELANPYGLMRANELHEQALARSVENSFITTAEQVDAAAVVVDPRTDKFFARYHAGGRATGNDAARNLFRGEGSFEGIRTDLNILPYVIGVAGGMRLEVKADERWEMQRATSLKDAQRKAFKFGNNGPQNEEELERLKSQGASEVQMAGINTAVRTQIAYLKSVGKVVERGDPYSESQVGEEKIWLPDKTHFNAEFDQEITKVVGIKSPSRRYSAWVRIGVGGVLQCIYEGDFGLKRGKSSYGIFFNDPSWEQLGIGEDQIRALRRYYKRKETNAQFRPFRG